MDNIPTAYRLWGDQDDGVFAEYMNTFYSSFDTHDFHSVINGIVSSTKTHGKLEIEENDVLRVLQMLGKVLVRMAFLVTF